MHLACFSMSIFEDLAYIYYILTVEQFSFPTIGFSLIQLKYVLKQV